MKTDYIYWNTFCEYLVNNNFSLNGDLTHDAKVIKETQYLWREASKRYLKNMKPNYLVEMYCHVKEKECDNYEKYYKQFISYLYYSTDRMNINRWLCLQMTINYIADLIYNEWIDQFNYKNWTQTIENGWTKKGITQLQEDCVNEFKTVIKPLIIENQKIRKENENRK